MMGDDIIFTVDSDTLVHCVGCEKEWSEDEVGIEDTADRDGGSYRRYFCPDCDEQIGSKVLS